MTDDPRTKPLREWSNLARENTENAIVSAMFKAAGHASAPIDQFTTWLLVGTAAIASFFITNSDKLQPLLGNRGFITCGALLCLSCFFGLLSKTFGLRCRIGYDVNSAMQQTVIDHLEKYEIEEEKINEGADFWGINLQTEIRIDRVMTEFFKPLPKWVVWLASRHFKKHVNDPQIGYIQLIKSLNSQSILSFFQALTFLGFLTVGFIFVSI